MFSNCTILMPRLHQRNLLRAASCVLRATCCGQQASCCPQQVACCAQHVASSNKLRATCCAGVNAALYVYFVSDSLSLISETSVENNLPEWAEKSFNGVKNGIDALFDEFVEIRILCHHQSGTHLSCPTCASMKTLVYYMATYSVGAVCLRRPLTPSTIGLSV